MKTATNWTDDLRALDACSEAVEWAQRYDSLEVAWDACDRADWMLWLIGRTVAQENDAERRRIVRVACQCARLALPYTEDRRVLNCIETTEAWARGEATIEEVLRVRRDAASASYSAASAAASAAAVAAYAAATSAAAVAAASTQLLKECADIVRKEYPQPPQFAKRGGYGG